MAPRSPFVVRLGAALSAAAALTALPGCPGFGDRLPPDATAVDAADTSDAESDALPADDARSPAPEGDAAGGTPVDAAPPATPHFTPEVEDFLAAHCALCHGERPVGGAPYGLVSRDEVVAHLEAVVDRVVVRRDMPPGGGAVTDAERDMLTRWAEAGAPP